jgi:hypothetical protein
MNEGSLRRRERIHDMNTSDGGSIAFTLYSSYTKIVNSSTQCHYNTITESEWGRQGKGNIGRNPNTSYCELVYANLTHTSVNNSGHCLIIRLCECWFNRLEINSSQKRS